MITIDFTYDVVTPESAEHGDVAECGFITPGFWRYLLLRRSRYRLSHWRIDYLRNAH